jgi:hypothetical protein
VPYGEGLGLLAAAGGPAGEVGGAVVVGGVVGGVVVGGVVGGFVVGGVVGGFVGGFVVGGAGLDVVGRAAGVVVLRTGTRTRGGVVTIRPGSGRAGLVVLGTGTGTVVAVSLGNTAVGDGWAADGVWSSVLSAVFCAGRPMGLLMPLVMTKAGPPRSTATTAPPTTGRRR